MPAGRPSSYDPNYALQVKKLCLLGATDADIARFFEVDVTTVDRWKLAHEEFRGALKAGKEEADAKVAQSLYHRARGYRHEAVKIFADPKTGAEKVVPYTEVYAPDTTAAIFWLKNRRPDLWRDKHEIVNKQEVEHSIAGLETLPADRMAELIAILDQAAASEKPPLPSKANGTKH